MPVHAIVLAAGQSSRLGRPKQLELINGQPLLRRTVQTVLQSKVDQVHIVLGFRAEDCLSTLYGLKGNPVDNPDWAEGMASSIRHGIAAAQDAEAVIILPCDLPLLASQYLDRLVDLFESGPELIASTWENTIGPPALFGRKYFEELAALQGDQGARKLFNKHPDQLLTVPFEAGAVDIDTPADRDNLGINHPQL